MEQLSTNNSTSKKQRSTRVTTQCKICGIPTEHFNFGVISCAPCKMFFKRNAEKGQQAFKCPFDGHCEIDINSRHVCSYCRLKKCFQCGMEIERFQASLVKKKKKNEKRKLIEDSQQTISNALIRLNELEQLPTLNLLRSDQSTLTIEQWNLISNLSKCYDEYSGLSIGERYMREQSHLPLKLRYKGASVIGVYQMIMDGTQLLYKNSRDFQSLSPDDRSILLHTTIKQTASLSSNFILYQVRLMDQPAYYDTVAIITHPHVVNTAKRMTDLFNFDMIVMKLFLAILSFSTSNYTIYLNSAPVNLSNIKQILHIQDTYIELLWRHLFYKYNFEYAVRCFSDFIRCTTLLIDALDIAYIVPWFEDAIGSITQQTEETLTLNE